MDISDAAMRVALTRLVASGKLTRPERGTYAIDREAGALARTVNDWKQKHLHTQPWRGDWLAVHDADVQRSDKSGWRRHSLAMALRGFAPLRSSLLVRPNNLAGGLVAERHSLLALGLSSRAMVFCLTDLEPSRQADARALWDTGRLGEDHRRLRMALCRSQRLLPKQKLESALRESLVLGRTVIAYLLRDPVLPPELMGPGSRVALVEAMSAYQIEALRLWRRWFSREFAG